MTDTGVGCTGAAAWRLLMDGAADGAWNMAADEAMLAEHAQGRIPPTLRFYSWRPAAISLGYFQRAEREIDLNACASRKIDVIRRLTGGRAVLHDAEVTYSLVVKESDPYIPEGITASYLFFSRGIAAGLARLGVSACLQEPRLSQGTPHSAACFDAPSHYELTVGGRKLVGSAQLRRDGILLQHGSVLLAFHPEELTELFLIAARERRDKITAELSRHATSLDEATGKCFGFAEVATALAGGIAEKCGLALRPAARTARESVLIENFQQKYRSPEWTLRC